MPPSPRVTVRCALVGVLAMVCSLLSMPTAAAATPEGRSLAEAKEKLDALRERIDSTRDTREKQAAQLADTKDQVADALISVREAEAAVDRRQAAVDDARDDLAGANSAFARARRRASDRVARLYMRGAGSELLNMVAAARDLSDFAARSEMVRSSLRADRAALEELDAARTAVQAREQHLAKQQRQLEAALRAEREMLAQLEALRSERALALEATEAELDELAGDEQHLVAEAAQLERAARRSAAAVAGGASRSMSGLNMLSAPTVATSIGGWTWPASGPLTSGFGWRWGRQHEGVDIGAGYGAPIVAARAGTVSYASTMSGYGNVVMIDHGGGYRTVYAHMSRIMASVGAHVGAGQQIGAIGCSGSCSGPHLHFEIRVGGGPRNPMTYLP